MLPEPEPAGGRPAAAGSRQLPSGARAAPRQTLALLAAAVLCAHLWLAGRALPPQLGDGAAATALRRIDVAFVRELAQAAPPERPAAAAPPPLRRPVARPAELPASSPELPPLAQALPAALPSPPEPGPQPEPALPALADLLPPVPSQAALAAVAQAAPPPASAAGGFDWPPSTRLSYSLTGHYRGPVEGQARVEWLRSGSRYQVAMEVSIGPSFAPLLSRTATSEGEITPEGLRPRRYEEVTKAVLVDARRSSIAMDGDMLRFSNGLTVPRPSGVQDSASQFVHLTWLFTTQPEWLTPGRAIEIPLALPRNLQLWTYDVIGAETLATRVGAVETVHVKPRREATAARAGSSLAAEMWVAPSLQYLPVRIVIRQDAETFVDLLIERLPQQAAAEATPPGR